MIDGPEFSRGRALACASCRENEWVTSEVNATRIKEHAEQVRTVGYTILKNHLPTDVITSLAAAFAPIYEDHLDEIVDKLDAALQQALGQVGH